MRPNLTKVSRDTSNQPIPTLP